MATETFEALLPAFRDADLVFLQGWGEPLLHPDFWTMVRRASEAGPRVGFTTNGVALNRENRRALLESGVDVMGVSLAGARRGTHDRFRQGAPLDRLKENLTALRREGKALGKTRPDIHLAYLLLAENAGDLPATVELAERWEARQIVVSPLSLVLTRGLEARSLLATQPERRRWKGERSPDEEVTTALKEARARAHAAGIEMRVYGFDARRPRPTCHENVLNSCFVSASGHVSPCVMTNLGLREDARATHRFQGREIPLRTLSWGNVRDRSLETIWRSGPAGVFRGLHRERAWRGAGGFEGLPTPCRTCYKILES